MYIVYILLWLMGFCICHVGYWNTYILTGYLQLSMADYYYLSVSIYSNLNFWIFYDVYTYNNNYGLLKLLFSNDCISLISIVSCLIFVYFVYLVVSSPKTSFLR